MLEKSMKVAMVVVMIGLILGSVSLLLSAAGDPEAGAMTQLDPGEQHWYTLTYQGNGASAQVRMNVDPDGGASFKIITPDAIRAWEAGEEMGVTGRGTKNKHEEADLTWSGSFGQSGTYHLIVEYSGNGQDTAFHSLDVSGADVSADAPAAEEGTAITEEVEATKPEEAEPQSSSLATASAVSRLSNQPGRAIVTARGNHFVVDSVPPLGGPNEEINPLDLMLGALATCGTFVYETAADEMGISLTGITATVEGDFNALGVVDGSVNPRIQALRVHMDIPGTSGE